MSAPYTILRTPPDQFFDPAVLDPTGGSVGDIVQIVDIGGGVLRFQRVAPGSLGGPVGLPYIIPGGGLPLITGPKEGFIRIPFDGLIVGWSLYGDGNNGSIVIDTWKDTAGNFPPTVADSIWGGSKPTISSALGAVATGLSIAVTTGDVLRHNVDSVTGFLEATLNYHFVRT